MTRFWVVLIALFWAGALHAASLLPNALPPRGLPALSDITVLQQAGNVFVDQSTLAIQRQLDLTSLRSFGAVGDGSVDDTTAIQNALNSGKRLYCDEGAVFKTTATLTLTSTNNNGQALAGAGPVAGDGSGLSKCVIRPTVAVSVAFLLDGSSYGGYTQNVAFENFALDMVNMASGTTGFKQLQSYDILYRNVRVLNDTGKRSWWLAPGAYTTHMDSVQGTLVYCLGTGVNNPTTLVLTNPDIRELDVEQCANVTTLGGTVQPLYSTAHTVTYVPPGARVLGFGSIPTTGLYLSLGSYTLNAQYVTSVGTDWEAGSQPPATCSVSGWAFGTFNDGTHGCAPMVMGVSIGPATNNASFVDPTFAGMYLYNLGGTGNNLTVTGYQSGGGQGNYHEGAETFDANMFVNLSKALFGYSGDRAGQTFLLDASTGSASFVGSVAAGSVSVSGQVQSQTLGVTATANGNFVNWLDDNNHPLFGCYAGGTRASDSCFINSLNGYSDDAGTHTTYSLNGNNGSAIFVGNVQVGSLNSGGVVTPWVRTTPTTVAGLSTVDPSPLAGDRAAVTDALACSFGSAPAGSGSIFCPVVYNGTAWVGG